MTKNPYINALIAGGYIAGIVLLITTITKPLAGKEDTVVIPMVMLSLLVFSVALMGVIFFYEPVILLLDNKRKEAVTFFAKTLATFFGVLVLLIFLMVSLSL